MKISSNESFISPNCFHASSNDLATNTPLGTSNVALRVKTTLVRPCKGRNFVGILSHVFLPIITAFCLTGAGGVGDDAPSVAEPEAVALLPTLLLLPIVISLKCFISPGSFHGKSPFQPIPRDVVDAATIAVAAISFTIIAAFRLVWVCCIAVSLLLT